MGPPYDFAPGPPFARSITVCQSLLQASYQRSITIKYRITVTAVQRSPATSSRSLVFFRKL